MYLWGHMYSNLHVFHILRMTNKKNEDKNVQFNAFISMDIDV